MTDCADEGAERLMSVDGCPVAVRWFEPDHPRAVVMVAPAMGVTQDYYAPLARWLAGRGCACVTFDYRGTGASLTGPLRGFEATLADWGERDCGTVLDAAGRRHPGLPLIWIGHSLGGQLLPLVQGADTLAAVIMVAVGGGYWREWAPRVRRRALLLWYLVAPVSIGLAGYFPGRRLGIVGDLPAGVMRQWRRWCLHPDYAAGAEGGDLMARFAALAMPIHALYFSDDELLTPASIEALHALFRGAPKRIREIRPQDAGVARIGHFGFFRPQFQESLWTRYLLPCLRSVEKAT